MRSIEVEGKTIEAAVEMGLAALGIPREDARIDVLSEVGGRPRVKVSRLDDPAVDPPTLATPVTSPRPPVSRETATTFSDDGTFPGKQFVVETLQVIVDHLGITPRISVPAGPTDNDFIIEVSGEGAALLIGRHGQVLEATEYLLNRVAFSGGGPAPRVQVDVEGYRARREASLEEMARRTAETVRQSGRPVVLQPMSPRDRRIVHVVLQDDPTVATHSEGDGPFRTLVVTPAGHSRA